MSYGNTWIVPCGLFCIYPIIIHLLIVYGSRYLKSIDWSHIELPWRKHD